MSQMDDMIRRLQGASGIRSSRFTRRDITSVYQSEISGHLPESKVVGAEVLHKNLNILMNTMVQAAGSIARMGANEIKIWSQRFVPYDTGTLYNSCECKSEQFSQEELPPDETDTQVWHWGTQVRYMRGRAVMSQRIFRSWYVRYTADHAWLLHENPVREKSGNRPTINPNPPVPAGVETAQGGRRDHYLQEAYDLVRPRYPDMAQRTLVKELEDAPFIAPPRPVPASTTQGRVLGPARLRK